MSSRTLALIPGPLSALCRVGLPSAAHMVRTLAFQPHGASISQSIGERRQQSFAGGSLPDRDGTMGGSVGS